MSKVIQCFQQLTIADVVLFVFWNNKWEPQSDMLSSICQMLSSDIRWGYIVFLPRTMVADIDLVAAGVAVVTIVAVVVSSISW